MRKNKIFFIKYSLSQNFFFFCIIGSYILIYEMIVNIIKKNTIILFKKKSKWYVLYLIE
jgi:hypothetical protein